MIFEPIHIPIISAYNWEGFQPQQMYDIQASYCQRHYIYDISYQQFRFTQDKDYVLRLRDESHNVIKQWDFNQTYYASSRYPYLYDVYFDLNQEEGEYYLDIYNSTDDTISANTHPFYIVEEVEKHLPYEGYNELDKDGWIFTETTGKFVRTEDSVGAGAITVSGTDCVLTVATSGTAVTAKMEDKDGTLISTKTFSGTTVTFNDIDGSTYDLNTNYRVFVYDTNDDLLSYTNWFQLRLVLGSYVLYAQNRIRMRIESNIRQDDVKETSTFNQFTDQDFDTRTTSSNESTTATLTFGAKGVPNWLARKINRLMGLNHIYLKGEEYSKTDDLGQEEERENLYYGFSIPKYEVQKSDHQEFEDNVIGAIITNENNRPLANEDSKLETL